LTAIMFLYVVVEGVVAIMRIPFSKYAIGINIRVFFNSVIIPVVPLAMITTVSGVILSHLLQLPYSFIITIVATGFISLVVAWIFTLDDKEQAYVKGLLYRKKAHAED